MASRENSLGAQQGFETGATRSADDHKIDFEGHLHPEVLHYFGEYMHKHRTQRDGQVRASDNWQLGIPLHKYMKSLVRHTFDLWRAWRGYETRNPDTGAVQSMGELCCAILFNVQGLMLELLNSARENDPFMPADERKEIENPGVEAPVRLDQWEPSQSKVEMVKKLLEDAKEAMRLQLDEMGARLFANPPIEPSQRIGYSCPQDPDTICTTCDQSGYEDCIVFADATEARRNT